MKKAKSNSALDLMSMSRVNATPTQCVYGLYVGTSCPFQLIVPKTPRKPSKMIVFMKTLLNLGKWMEKKVEIP